MNRWTRTIWQCFGIWLLLLATAVPDLHSYVPLLVGERAKEEKEEKNGPCEEERTKEAVVHAVRRHCGDHHKRQSLDVTLPPSALHPRAAAWQGQVCLVDGLQGERGFYNGCGATLLR